MKRRTLYSLSANPFQIWTHLAFKLGEMMLASAMACSCPTPSCVLRSFRVQRTR
jgi:hypothetical protein